MKLVKITEDKYKYEFIDRINKRTAEMRNSLQISFINWKNELQNYERKFGPLPQEVIKAVNKIEKDTERLLRKLNEFYKATEFGTFSF